MLHALRTGPLLVASEVLAVPPDLLFQHPAWTGAAVAGSIAALAALAYAAFPLLRRDRTSRFFALGAVASVLPMGGTFPTDRYLFGAGIGVMGCSAAGRPALLRRPARQPRARLAIAGAASC